MSEPTPAYQLSFEKRPGYLYARVTADAITEEIAAEYLTAVAHECTTTHSDRLMIYRDIPNMLHDGPMFLVATEFRRRIGHIRVAFVNPYLDNQEAFDFGVQVGTNRGADYGLFDNVTDAEHWLLSG